LIQIH